LQGVAESGSDQNFSTHKLVTSQSGPVAAEAAVKRKAEMDYVEEQVPVKKMKSGNIYNCHIVVTPRIQY